MPHHYIPRDRQWPTRHRGSLYDQALGECHDVLYDVFGRGWERVGAERWSSVIDEMKRRVEASDTPDKPARLVALLLLQTPRAARAQDAMDRRHGGSYHHRSKRLYELIDFNDTFVDIVLSLHTHQRAEFARRIYSLMRETCRRVRTRMFSPQQFDAIVHGLSRETAVYLGARAEGLDVQMTSRVADGMGVDMQVRDPVSGRSINIDCKTTGSYLYRVETLRREGRLSEQEVAVALTRGFVRVINGHGDRRIEVVLFAVVSELFGGVHGFEFGRTDLLGVKLRDALTAYGVARKIDFS